MKALLSIVILGILAIVGASIVGIFLNSNTAELSQASALAFEQFKPILIPAGDPGIAREIKADLSQQRIFTYENGTYVRAFSISSGKADTPTPLGTFKVIHRQELLFSKIAGCWLSYWVGFTANGKYGLHETPVCDGVRRGGDMIGTPDSAGCLRLKQGEAQKLYEWATIGTIVTVY